MIDPIRIVQRWLLGSTSVTALLGTNDAGSVYGGGDLPEGFDPDLGPCVQIYGSGGTSHEELTAEIMPRITIKCWSGVNGYAVSRALAAAVHDVIHGADMVDFGDDGRVLSGQCVQQPQDITDPDDSWVYTMTIYQMDMIQTAPASINTFVNSQQTVQEYIDSKLAEIAGIDDNL